MGILGTLMTVYYMLDEHGPVVRMLQLSFDGKLVLSCAASTYPISITEPHANILSTILNVHKQIQCHITFKHVQGHQDMGHAMALEQDATLNVAMDHWAKEKIEDAAEPSNYQIPFEGWTCYIRTRKIIKQWQLKLWEHLNGEQLCKHWHMMGQLGVWMAEQLDWESVS